MLLWDRLTKLFYKLLLCILGFFSPYCKVMLLFRGFFRMLVILVWDVRPRVSNFVLPGGTCFLLEAASGEKHIQIAERVCLWQGPAHLYGLVFTDGLQSRWTEPLVYLILVGEFRPLLTELLLWKDIWCILLRLSFQLLRFTVLPVIDLLMCRGRLARLLVFMHRRCLEAFGF